jgi:two-component system sensor histidine kinase KdpD
MYALSGALSDVTRGEEVVRVAEEHIGQAAAGQATILLSGGPAVAAGGLQFPVAGVFSALEVRVAAQWAFGRGESAGRGTEHCADADALVAPLHAPGGVLGVVAFLPGPSDRMPTAAERATIEVLAGQAGAALERTLLAQRHEEARTEVEAERLRTALLSSLSHDLRTPLGSIEGAASTLLEERGTVPVEVRHDLAGAILEESRRMSRLVANLLDMVRVETGALAVRKSWQPLEEVLGVVLVRMEDRLRSHPVTIRLPDDLPLVPVDELLLEQVFINLLENAARYTAASTPVSVRAWTDSGAVVVEVADRGTGVPTGQEEAVFRKFHRGSGAGSFTGGGAGLGLTICRGIVTAHGGSMSLDSQPGAGAAFRFTIPLDGPPLDAIPAERQEE